LFRGQIHVPEKTVTEEVEEYGRGNSEGHTGDKREPEILLSRFRMGKNLKKIQVCHKLEHAGNRQCDECQHTIFINGNGVRHDDLREEPGTSLDDHKKHEKN
jgi:hypothetical protein